MRRCSSNSSLGFGRTGPSPPYPGGHGALAGLRRLSVGGARPFQLSPQGLLECTDVSENVSLLSLLLFFFFLSPPLSHLPLCLKWVPSLSCQGRRTRWAQTQVAEGRRAEVRTRSSPPSFPVRPHNFCVLLVVDVMVKLVRGTGDSCFVVSQGYPFPVGLIIAV